MRRTTSTRQLARQTADRKGISGLAAAMLTALFACSAPVAAQNFPSKPIRIIANSSAGALTDGFARVFAQKLQERSGQAVVVENRSTATGTLGADFVAKSPPDGYTLLVASQPSIVTLPLLNPNSPYTSKEFAPVAYFGSTPTVLLVHKSVPVNSVKELITLAKSKPSELPYGSQGIASSGHMATVQFILATGVDIVHVPFRGSAPALTALIGGQVPMLFETVRGDSIAQVEAGNVRALAVSARERVAKLPNVPTMAEAGIPDIEAGFWIALFAPANTPPAIVNYLNRQAQQIFSQPDVRDIFEKQGLVLSPGPPEALGSIVLAETKRWGDVIRRVDMKFPE